MSAVAKGAAAGEVLLDKKARQAEKHAFLFSLTQPTPHASLHPHRPRHLFRRPKRV